MERLSTHSRMAGALAAIGAVVTAVIAHLALWFAGSVFMTQSSSGSSFHPLTIVMALVALVLLRTERLGIASLILLSGMTGVLVRLLVA